MAYECCPTQCHSMCAVNCTTQDWSFNRECLLKSLLFWDRLKLMCLVNDIYCT